MKQTSKGIPTEGLVCPKKGTRASITIRLAVMRSESRLNIKYGFPVVKTRETMVTGLARSASHRDTWRARRSQESLNSQTSRPIIPRVPIRITAEVRTEELFQRGDPFLFGGNLR